MTKIPFWKMHGAGNDFIMIDDRAETFPTDDAAWIRRMATRRFGVGSEGVILIQPSTTADFRMRFYNPDGSEVEMCGNGARCVARLAHELGVAGPRMHFDTVAGRLGAEVREDSVTLEMTKPTEWTLNGSLDLDGTPQPYHAVNSGVPHVVVVVEDVQQVDLLQLGAHLRYHEHFAPAGTNVNVIHITGPDALEVRTYERGVEAETLACGTGMVACGLVAGKLGLVSAPVQVKVASGDVLQVGFDTTADGARNVTLTGPAVHVFQGELDYPG